MLSILKLDIFSFGVSADTTMFSRPTADEVWDRNFDKIQKITNYIKSCFRITQDSFNLEAQNLFYKNFEVKYDSDATYISYFYKCVKNKAISDFNRQKKWEARHVSNPSQICSGLGIYYDDTKDGQDIISSAIHDKRVDIHSVITVKEIDELMKGMLAPLDFQVYQHIKEGYKLNEISEICQLSVIKIQTIRDRIRFAIKQVTDMSDEEYERLTTKRGTNAEISSN